MCFSFRVNQLWRITMSSSGGGTHHPIPEFRDADHFWGSGLSQVNGSHEIIRPKPRRWVPILLSSFFPFHFEREKKERNTKTDMVSFVCLFSGFVCCIRIWFIEGEEKKNNMEDSLLAHLIISECVCFLNKRKTGKEWKWSRSFSLGQLQLCAPIFILVSFFFLFFF